MVCLIFIFLTPKWWFTGGELPLNWLHQSPVARTVVLRPEVVVNEADKAQIAKQVEAVYGLDKVEVVDVRKVVDREGRTRSFEVDIR